MPTSIRFYRRSGFAFCLLVVFALPGIARADTPASALGISMPPPASISGEKASALLRDIAANVDPVVSASQPLLLGRRSPNDGNPSRVVLRHINNGTKRLPIWPQDVNGGPGRRIGALYISAGRGKTPMADFVWQQTRFKPVLKMLRDQNRPIFVWASRLSYNASELFHGLKACTEWPAGFVATAVSTADHWPEYCLRKLNEAVAARDLSGAKRWSGELAAATFALTDLHHWLEFLLQNQLTSLAFQAKCQGLFARCEKLYGDDKYQAMFHADRFPGGYLGLAAVSNYLEIERQAEFLFRVPKEYLQAARADVLVVPGAVWMPPDLRKAFGQLGKSLSAGNQTTWALAARTPLERSYLANMLYRGGAVRVLDRLGVVLKRFDKAYPHAHVPELMDVLFYRGGDGFAGFEWADRFDTRLMAMAEKLAGNDESVLANARKKTFGVFSGWDHYEGFVITLRESLNSGKMDCVRATDMIGSLYRNAGRAGFRNIRWLCGVGGHTVAAAEIRKDGKTQIVIVDGLDSKPNGREVWSKAYFQGHQWPTDFPGRQAPAYAFELNGRGLDSYVWVEGHVVQGPSTGLSVQAAIPYMLHRGKLRITQGTKPIDTQPPISTTIGLGPRNGLAAKPVMKKSDL